MFTRAPLNNFEGRKTPIFAALRAQNGSLLGRRSPYCEDIGDIAARRRCDKLSTELKAKFHYAIQVEDLVADVVSDLSQTGSNSFPLAEFCEVQNSLCVQVLRSPILAALLHGTPAAAVSQTLQRSTRDEITELSQTAPPIFGWAAITFGIGPHSSCN